MEGSFIVIYKDYFGEIHETHVWAQTSEIAIKRFDKRMDYYYEIVDCYWDYKRDFGWDDRQNNQRRMAKIWS